MGTVFSFAVVPDPSADVDGVRRAVGRACQVLHDVDARFSLWKPASPMSRLRRGEIGVEEAGPDFAEVAERCERARSLSGGLFDPWALPGGYDPTGLVKGWATERALGVLRYGAEVAAAMVNGGGDIACFGRPAEDRPWRIGIDDPNDPARIAVVVEGWPAVATSGTYQRGPHLVDPVTRQPALVGEPAPLAATVVGQELWLADALATAAAITAPDVALAMVEDVDGYEAMVTTAEGERRLTSGFRALSV